MEMLEAFFEFLTSFLSALGSFLNDKSTFDEVTDILTGIFLKKDEAAE